MKKSIITILLCLISISAFSDSWDGTIAGSYGGGDGSKDRPYLISNASQLARLADEVSKTANVSRGKYYKLTADIVMNENVLQVAAAELNGGSAFPKSPMIGDYSGDDNYMAFQGVFDGDGHTISGYYVLEYNNYASIFRVVENAVIKNLRITDSYIYNNTYAAGLASRVINSTIVNCRVEDAHIEGYGSYEGGVAGQLLGSSKIINSYSNTEIAGKNNVGGIVGRIGDGTANNCLVDNCFSISSITIRKTNKGGITAELCEGATVRNCFYLNSDGQAVYSNKGTVENNTGMEIAEFQGSAIVASLNSTAEGLSGACRWTQSSPCPIFDFSIINEDEVIDDVNARATDPTPADGDLHADADNGTVTLQWAAPADGNTLFQYLFFGTDSAEVMAMDPSQALAVIETDTSYVVEGLDCKKVYYWRIDREDSQENITKGELWSFQPRHLAFPGAEGYGRFAHGGRGGKVVYVTNLNDSGPGSLREAVTNDIGPRTIVFNVSGVIKLDSRITVPSSDVTIAGQTAPGKGICISSAPFGISDDNICRFMRVRIGSGETYDGMGMAYADHAIMDHCSISWSIDEGFSSRGCKNLTLQRTMIAEALGIAGHRNYEEGKNHGFAATIGGDIGSFHHNFLVDCNGRNWSMGGGLDANGYYAGRLDIFNNVVYNWCGRTTDGGAHEVNFVGNYYKEGPAVSNHAIFTLQLEGTGKGSQSAYLKNNILDKLDGSINIDAEGMYGKQVSAGQSVDWDPFPTTPFFESYAEIQSPKDAYKSVLSDNGANQPFFDEHDQRMVYEAANRTYTYVGSKSGLKGEIDSETDCGGLEVYPVLTWDDNFDSDKDGMPDWWEEIIGTDKNSASGYFSDSNADADGDGYTNLEEYLNWLAEPHITIAPGNAETVNIKALFRGYTDAPQYSYSYEEKNLSLAVADDSLLTVTAADGYQGLQTIALTVTDSEGSTMTRNLNVGVTAAVPSAGIETVKAMTTEMTHFAVYSLDGKMVMSGSMDNKNINQLQLNNLEQGVYVIKTTDRNGKSYSYKAIKK